MKIELKNLKINKEFSEETIMFKASVYVDGEKVAEAENEGRGGSTHYWHLGTDRSKELIKKAEGYCLALPSIKVQSHGTELLIDQNLSDYIDKLVYDVFNKKEQLAFEKKKLKAMERGLVISKGSGDDGFEVFKWKGFTLNSLTRHPLGTKAISDAILKYKAQGYRILNTNLPTFNHLINA